jgi:hypothetical protein
MKFEIGVVFGIFILLVGFVSGAGVDCTIVNGRVLVEVSEGEGLVLPQEYSLLERGEGSVSFISGDYLRKSDGGWIFVLPKIIDGVYDLRVYLPEGYVLSDGLAYPKDYGVSSDGRRIILEWSNIGDEAIVFYEGVSESNIWIWVAIFVLILFGFVLRKIKIKMVSDRNLVSQNLFGDEKAIVEFLLKREGKSCWTKELTRGLGISKVRLSRKVRSLVEKGIVSREGFGRENRIGLIGR